MSVSAATGLAPLAVSGAGTATAPGRSVGVSPEDFGAVGDGVGNDRKAVQAAFDAALSAGVPLNFSRNAVYFLGEFATSTDILRIAPTNLVVNGNGATLLCRTNAAGAICRILTLDHPVNVQVNNLNARDSGAVISETWRGAAGFWLQTSGSSGFCGNVQFNHCSGESLVTWIGVGGNVEQRIRGVTINGGYVRNCYYGINCQENGDHLAATYSCENVRRAYFAYGVNNHDIDVDVYHDGKAPGANTACLIKRYARDTRNIRLRVGFRGSVAAYGHGVSFEHQPAAGSGTIEDVSVELNLNGVTGSFIPFQFSSLLANGTEQTATTNNVWRCIGIGGNFASQFAAQGRVGIDLRVSPAVEADIWFSPQVTHAAQLYRPADNWVLRWAPDRETRMCSGELATRTVLVPLARYAGQAFALRLRVRLYDGAADAAQQPRLFEERLLTGYRPAGSATAIWSNELLHGGQPAAGTLSYAGVADGIRVGFAGAGIVGANAMARIDVEYL